MKSYYLVGRSPSACLELEGLIALIEHGIIMAQPQRQRQEDGPHRYKQWWDEENEMLQGIKERQEGRR